MRYDTRYRSRSSLFNWSFPTGVKWLVISNVAVHLINFFGSLLHQGPIFGNLELMPVAVIHGHVWQLVTYLFLHDLASPWHILFNMLTLWMFGAPIEETWGTRRFLQYYFVCGIGAGICVVLANTAFVSPLEQHPVIGASGAIYGLLLAFGMLFPNQTVLFSFLFPIKAKYMVMIFGAITFMTAFESNTKVSNLAHLGGLIFGFAYMKTQFGSRVGGSFDFDFQRRWKEYKLLRARKKFKVYLKKHGSDRDPWVN